MTGITSRRPGMGLCQALLGLLCCSGLARANPDPDITVTLRAAAQVAEPIVRLGDIAEIKASSEPLCRQLRDFDLIVFKEPGDAGVVTARQVRVRLLLEGVQGRHLKIDGAAESTVVWTAAAPVDPAASIPPASAETVVDQIRRLATATLADVWLVSPDDIELQLYAGNEALGAGAPAGSRLEVQLPNRVEPGRVSAQARWTSNGKIDRIEQVVLDVRLRQDVLLVAANISRGEVVTADHLLEERRLLSSRVDPIPVDDVVGRTARRPLSPGEILSTRDLVTAQMSTPQIKTRDLVKVVVRKGPLTVVLQSAEALQSGRIGESIRVRNAQSNQVIVGRVISAKEVEVVLE